MKLITAALSVFVFAIIIASTTSASIEKSTETVLIPNQGKVQGGIDETSWTKQKFYAFRRVPYAESPSGKLRFQPPKSRAPWKETLDVSEYGIQCPNYENLSQLNNTRRKEDLEDCLTLSIYSKNLNAKSHVMFYVHGGSFRNGGSSRFSPRSLMEKDVVLVLVQYRTGPLGFMTTFTKDIPGNVAIMDIQLGLNWVQKNIHVFGGDPKKVTIFGQSAGAALVSATVVSPKTSADYFQKSIIQSGSVMGAWTINREVLQQMKSVCEALGCKKCDNVKGQNKCIKKADVVDLIIASQPTDQGIKFSPVIGDLNGVLPEEPKALLAKYNRSIPLMTGFTKEDGSFIMSHRYDDMLKLHGSMSNVTVRQLANYLIGSSKSTTGLENNLLLQKFFKPEILDTKNHRDALLSYFDINNAIDMKSPVIAFANAMQRKCAPVYMYSFDYVGENSGFRDSERYPFKGGVYHGDDRIHLFDMAPLNSRDTKFAKKLVDLWYSFAVDGVPKIADEPDLIIKPMETESGPYFHINEQITFGDNVLTEFTATSDDPESYKLIKPNASEIIAQSWN